MSIQFWLNWCSLLHVQFIKRTVQVDKLGKALFFHSNWAQFGSFSLKVALIGQHYDWSFVETNPQDSAIQLHLQVTNAQLCKSHVSGSPWSSDLVCYLFWSRSEFNLERKKKNEWPFSLGGWFWKAQVCLVYLLRGGGTLFLDGWKCLAWKRCVCVTHALEFCTGGKNETT